MDAFYFLKSNWKVIFDVTCSIRVMRQLHVIMEAVFACRDAKAKMPFHSFGLPVFIPFLLRTRADKELHFHLLKLAHPENKLARHNLISKRFTNLCNTKRNFHTPGFLHIQKVYEDTLCR